MKQKGSEEKMEKESLLKTITSESVMERDRQMHEAIAQTLTEEERLMVLQTLTPEQLLAGLTLEERLAGLTPMELSRLLAHIKRILKGETQ